MKKNMVPLLGIAFVVAIISTGVFYGLFAGKLRSKPIELPGHSIVVAARDLDRGTVIKPGDLQVSQVNGVVKGSFSKIDDAVGATLLEAVQQNEPLLEARVASRDPKAGAGSGVAVGMRAVSIRVAESSGLTSLMHGGSRVDIQAVMERNGSAELRTILQNVEVLRVNPQLEPAGNNRPPVPVATVLVPAQYADLIALADTGARVRLTLRNPLDEATAPRHSLGLASVFNGAPAFVSPNVQKASAAGAPERDIQLYVQVLGASATALGELDSKLASSTLASPTENDSLRVASFRADTNADELVRKLEQSKELELVSSSKLTAGVGRPASLRAAATPYRLRVQFSPVADSLGKVTLWVQPEISLRHGPGVETHRYDADLPNGGSFLVKGLFKDQSDGIVLGRLFPGHTWSGRALLIFVTTRTSGQAPPSAVAQTNRGQ